jgi:hypothetical protein
MGSAPPSADATRIVVLLPGRVEGEPPVETTVKWYGQPTAAEIEDQCRVRVAANHARTPIPLGRAGSSCSK